MILKLLVAARLAAAAVVTLLLVCVAAPISAQVAPDQRWRTLDTPHFRVTFPEGLELLGRETAARAEWAYELLSRELVDPPARRIDIVVTDDVDYANGSATPLPTNRIVLHAHPPTDTPELAYTADWLELLVLHELVHIFHLDHAGGIWRLLRGAFGRNAAFFPGAFTPSWLIEGLATQMESAHTAGGRVSAVVTSARHNVTPINHNFCMRPETPIDFPDNGRRLYLHLAAASGADGPKRLTTAILTA